MPLYAYRTIVKKNCSEIHIFGTEQKLIRKVKLSPKLERQNIVGMTMQNWMPTYSLHVSPCSLVIHWNDKRSVELLTCIHLIGNIC